MEFKSLSKPGKIGNQIIKNRLVMAPMGVGMMISINGMYSQRATEYYEERARGGVGLIISGATLSTNKYEPWAIGAEQLNLAVYDTLAKIRSLKELTERIHDYGCAFFLQITAGWGRIYRLSQITGSKAISPSRQKTFWNPNEYTRALTLQDIKGLTTAIANTAAIAREGGCDGIELHGHEGYLLDQFKTSLWNKRKDDYGGSFDNRMKFSLDIIKEIQKSAGKDYPISYRYGLEHKIPGGRRANEGIKIAKVLEKAGVAVLHVDAGCYESWHWPHPPDYKEDGCMVDMAELVKKNINIPVIAVGKLGDPYVANKVIEQGQADFVAMGRQLLADPNTYNKAVHGKVREIRPCIGCHECFKRLYDRTYLSCAVNPACGNEKRYKVELAEKPKKIVVIGGGVAGLEAAYISSKRGHEVIILEKTKKLGGLINYISEHRFKRDLIKYLQYQTDKVINSNITVMLGVEANNDVLKLMNYDALIIAIGSKDRELDVICDDKVKCFNMNNILESDVKLGDNVVIVGGGSAGCETALHLASDGRKITIIEQQEEVGRDLFMPNRNLLIKMLNEADINILTGKKVNKVDRKGVHCQDSLGNTEVVEASDIVSAVGRLKNCDMDWLQALNDEGKEIFHVGDCRTPGKIKNAIWDAFKVAINV